MSQRKKTTVIDVDHKCPECGIGDVVFIMSDADGNRDLLCRLGGVCPHCMANGPTIGVPADAIDRIGLYDDLAYASWKISVAMRARLAEAEVEVAHAG